MTLVRVCWTGLVRCSSTKTFRGTVTSMTLVIPRVLEFVRVTSTVRHPAGADCDRMAAAASGPAPPKAITSKNGAEVRAALTRRGFIRCRCRSGTSIITAGPTGSQGWERHRPSLNSSDRSSIRLGEASDGPRSLHRKHLDDPSRRRMTGAWFHSYIERSTAMNAHNTRRKFLSDVGRGMLVATVGQEVAQGLGLASAFAGEGADTLSFGSLEPLVCLMQETPADRLLPKLAEKLRVGTDLRPLEVFPPASSDRTRVRWDV